MIFQQFRCFDYFDKSYSSYIDIVLTVSIVPVLFVNNDRFNIQSDEQTLFIMFAVF